MDERFEKIRTCLAGALGIDEAEVTPEARLVGDLGAESIDFIDIIFRLEKAFGIRIPEGDLFPRGLFQDPALVREGRFTPAGLERIRRDFPFIGIGEDEAGLSLADLADRYTVGMLHRYVERRLAEQPVGG
jgi:acyl carrier protein